MRLKWDTASVTIPKPGESTVNNWQRWGVLLVIGIVGCSGGSSKEGSEAAARKFFDTEFGKWMAGNETQIATMESQLKTFKSPLGYDIRSVVPDEPDLLAIAKNYSKHGDSDEAVEYKAWKFNVVIEWESQAGTPIEKVATYNLTWNPRDKTWFVSERN